MAASAIASARATIGITGRELVYRAARGGGRDSLLGFSCQKERRKAATRSRRKGGGLENRFCRRISKGWNERVGRGGRAEAAPVNYLYQSLEIHSSKRGRFYRLTW